MEIWVVLLPSLTKSVTGLKWIRARLQTPSLHGPRDRSTTQEDRDRSVPKKPSSATQQGVGGGLFAWWLNRTINISAGLLTPTVVLLFFCAGLDNVSFRRDGFIMNKQVQQEKIMSLMGDTFKIFNQVCYFKEVSQKHSKLCQAFHQLTTASRFSCI